MRSAHVLVSGTLLGVAFAFSPVHVTSAAASTRRQAPDTAVRLTTLAKNDARLPTRLARPVSARLERTPVLEAMRAVARQAELRLTFDSELVPSGRTVTLSFEREPVANAMLAVLDGTSLDAVIWPSGQVIVVRRMPAASAGRAEQGTTVRGGGTVRGRVTDAATGEALFSATVHLEGTSYSVITSDSGWYRLVGVPAGAYTLTARRVGYEKLSREVTVLADEDLTADFSLEKSASILSQVVVTGTLAPTEIKALPTPISVFTAQDIQRQNITRVDQLFRGVMPGAVSFDQGPADYTNSATIRGANSLVLGGNSIKTYVDGVEVTSNTFAQLDVNMIDRVEVIRGPQASTIYGSDASGGVMQIFTKKGARDAERPHIDVGASAGVIQSAYQSGGTLRQDYSATLRGGRPDFSYNVGGTHSRIGDWLPDYGSNVRSGFGSTRLTQGRLTLDLSGRYFGRKLSREHNPILAATQYTPFSKSPFETNTLREFGFGANLDYAAASWWQHSLIVGANRFAYEYHRTRPRLTTPSDTLLNAYSAESGKTSVRYNTSITITPSASYSSVVTAGVEHYAYTSSQFQADATLNSSGPITYDPSVPPTLARGEYTNTGYFAQGVLNVRDALFLTAGVRAERNSNIGGSFGTAWAPLVGVSLVRDFRGVTAKLRAAYGRGIRPPAIGQSQGGAEPGTVTLPNPNLGPEQQQGVDGGIDLVFGQLGSIALTYYEQEARNLIDLVLVDPAATPAVFQFQNLSRIKNSGLESQGTLNLGDVTLTAQYTLMKSRVRRLSPTYFGDLQVGDQILQVPKHSGGAGLSYAPTPRTTIDTRLVYVGSFTAYDFLRLYGDFYGGGTFSGSLRDYWHRYPGFAKANMTVAQQLGSRVSAFLAVNNVTDSRAVEFGNINPVYGRVTVVGIRATY